MEHKQIINSDDEGEINSEANESIADTDTTDADTTGVVDV